MRASSPTELLTSEDGATGLVERDFNNAATGLVDINTEGAPEDDVDSKGKTKGTKNTSQEYDSGAAEEEEDEDENYEDGDSRCATINNQRADPDLSSSDLEEPFSRPNKAKKHLKQKLKSMTKLQRAKWIKMARKELIKRFDGVGLDGSNLEGEEDDFARNEDDRFAVESGSPRGVEDEKMKAPSEHHFDDEDVEAEAVVRRPVSPEEVRRLRLIVEKRPVRPYEPDTDDDSDGTDKYLANRFSSYNHNNNNNNNTIKKNNNNNNNNNKNESLTHNQTLLPNEILPDIFHHLNRRDLLNCGSVSRDWRSASLRHFRSEATSFKHCDFSSRRKIASASLRNLVFLQPEALDFSGSSIGRDQLSWLLRRIPRLRALTLRALPLYTVDALAADRGCGLFLRHLDLSDVDSFGDAELQCLVRFDAAASAFDSLSTENFRMRHLQSLVLSRTNVSDISLEALTKSSTPLRHLDVSFCTRITNVGFNALSGGSLTLEEDEDEDNEEEEEEEEETEHSNQSKTLSSLVLRGNPNVDDDLFEILLRMKNLSHLDLSFCGRITDGAFQEYGQKSKLVTWRNERKSIMINTHYFS